MYLREMKIRVRKKTCKHVLSSFIYNSPKLETAQMSFSK